MLKLHRHYYDDSNSSHSSPKQNDNDSAANAADFQRMNMHPYLNTTTTTNNVDDNSSRNNITRRRYSHQDESGGDSSSISSMGRGGGVTKLQRGVSGDSAHTAPATFAGANNKPSTNIYQMSQSTSPQHQQKPSPSNNKKRVSPTKESSSSSQQRHHQQQQNLRNSWNKNSSGHSSRSQANDYDGDDRIGLERGRRNRTPSKVPQQHDRSNTTIDTAALTNSSRSSFAFNNNSSRSFRPGTSPPRRRSDDQLNTTIDTAALTNSNNSSSRTFALMSSINSKSSRRGSFGSVRSREDEDNVSSKPPPMILQQNRQKSENTTTDNSHTNGSSHANITQSSSQDETNVITNTDDSYYLQEERQRRRMMIRGNNDHEQQQMKTISSSLSSYYVNQEKSGKKILLSGGRRNDISEKASRMTGSSDKRMILQEEQQLAYSGRQQHGLEERVVYPGAVHIMPDDPALYPGAVRVNSNRCLTNPYEKEIDDGTNDDTNDDDEEDNKTVQGGSSLSSRHQRRVYQMQDSIHEEEDESREGREGRPDYRRIPSSSTMSSLTTNRSTMMASSFQHSTRSLRASNRDSNYNSGDYNTSNNEDYNDCTNQYPGNAANMDINGMMNIDDSNSNLGRKSAREKFESFRKQWIILLTLVMVAIGIGLAVGFVTNNKKDNNPTFAGDAKIPPTWRDDDSDSSSDDEDIDDGLSWMSSSLLPWKKLGNDIIIEETLPIDGITQRYTVAMSDDGSIVAIGFPYSDALQETNLNNPKEENYNSGLTLTDAGIVKVYSFNMDKQDFQQLGTDLNGLLSGDWFGSCIALSADGTTLVVGATHNSEGGTHAGQVRIFRWNTDDGDWIENGLINGNAEKSIFGSSLSISNNGSVVAIGAPHNEGGVFGSSNRDKEAPGRVRIYEYKMTPTSEDKEEYYSWIQRGSDLIGETEGEEFGTSVSLSEDGSILVVGSPKYDQTGKYNDLVEEGGRAYMYRWNSATEYELLNPIDGDIRAPGDMLGDSVIISGSVLAVGAPTKDNIGYVRTYDVEISPNSTQEEGTIQVQSSKAITGSKISVKSISNDGSTVGIIVDENSRRGNTVLIYECNNSTNTEIWTIKGRQEKSVVEKGSSNDGGEYYLGKNDDSNDYAIRTPKIPGYAVAMNHDGERIAVASSYKCNDDLENNTKCEKYPVITVYEWNKE